jgi:hypothetical protein
MMSATFLVEKDMTLVGNMSQCASIRAKDKSAERCSNKAQTGTEWCGRHKTTQIRWVLLSIATSTSSVSSASCGAGVATVSHVASPPRKTAFTPPIESATTIGASTTIQRSWRRWLQRRSGPLLHIRNHANNPYDFFSSDPIEEIPLRDFVSFVDKDRKGYVMDIKSAVSLIEHATKDKQTPLNPFNREPLTQIFLKRIKLPRRAMNGWTAIKPATEEQKLNLAVTDVFRLMEDQGYYTDPQWFMDLNKTDLQRLYLEIADIWMHRAALSAADQHRIVPGQIRPIKIATRVAMVMQLKALRPLLLYVCKTLVSSAAQSSDKRLGVMYFLGALSCVSPGAGSAYPWLVEMFAPGAVTRVVGGTIQIMHPTVLSY